MDWEDWFKNIHTLVEYQIPRSFKPKFYTHEVELHIFSAGSEKAFAAVVYLRYKSFTGQISCSLIITKTLLIPLKHTTVTTIPRIDLNGLGVYLYQILKTELNLLFDKISFWNDSTTIIKYINNETRRFQRFISIRVVYVRKHKNKRLFYVP